MPFYIRKHDTLEKIAGAPGGNGMEAQVRNVWPGFKRECCTSADNYFVVFPSGSSTALKVRSI